MTALEVLLALSGFIVTVLVVAGMVLLTPRGAEQLDDAVRGTQGRGLEPRGRARAGTEADAVGH
jgi:hypothetical protein